MSFAIKKTLEDNLNGAQGFFTSLKTSWEGHWVHADFRRGITGCLITCFFFMAIALFTAHSHHPLLAYVVQPAFAGCSFCVIISLTITGIFLHLRFPKK